MVMHSRGSHTGIAYHTHLLTIGATLLTFLCQFRLTDNGDARNFQFGAIAQGSVGRKSPSGAQGRSPVRDLDICGMKSPRSRSSLQPLLQILTAETTEVWKICAQITPPPIIGPPVSWWGPSDISWGLNPNAMSGSRMLVSVSVLLSAKLYAPILRPVFPKSSNSVNQTQVT